MLELQKYIAEHGEAKAFSHFRDGLSLMVKEDAGGRRVLFKYSMIDSPMADPIVQEARGLILDRMDGWKVVSWPFRKFFNLGEVHAARIDLATARVQEKVDGTCITLYFWDGKWRVQTLGMMDADGIAANGFPQTTFHDLFHQVLGADLAGALSTDLGYTFELATPSNRVVTRYEKSRLVLLSIRHMPSLKELSFDSDAFTMCHARLAEKAPHIELPKVHALQVSCLGEVSDLAAALPPMEEGYVVVDGGFNRVKVKNPAYLALLHMKTGAASSVRSMVRLVLANEGPEFLAYFPEYQEQHDLIFSAVESVREKLEKVWEEAKGIEGQKEFALALAASKAPFTYILFALRKGSVNSIGEGMQKLDPGKLAETLRLEAC
jgi:hypothetical protein